MTTIKMNDGRTEYDVEDSYGDISESLLEEFIPEATIIKMGKEYI
ncbi:MAG: hypothetical protein [Bacteriophage sp.]|nr:MAG: hypothetical protein [Bacteriophage sp.]